MVDFTHTGRNNNGVSLLVTTDHDMYAKIGKEYGSSSIVWNGIYKT